MSRGRSGGTGAGCAHILRDVGYDVEAIRARFPVCRHRTYFDHAGVAPCAAGVRDAVARWMEDLANRGISAESGWEESLERVRDRVAELLGARPDEIAFTRSTSHGLSLIAEGLPWRAGDEVILCSEIEYPSNVYTWQQLGRRGVVVRDLPAVGGGVSVEAVEAALGPRTRAVAVSTVQFATGVRTDVDALGALCRDRGVLLIVDGIQSVGAFPIDVRRAGVAALSADSHKWMLGVIGIGVLYVSRDVVEQVHPVLVGWRTTADMWAFDGTRFQMRADAGRFEEGSLPYALIDGLGASLDLLLELGVDAIGAHITSLLERAEKGLVELGCAVTPPASARAGILLFAPPDRDAAPLVDALIADGFALSLRRGSVRISPHLYNTAAEIDRLVDRVAHHLRA